MKATIMTIVAMASITASAATYVTVTSCYQGEANNCHQVTYKVRKPSTNKPVETRPVASSEGEVQVPTKYGIPKWLQKLNDAAADHGFSAPNNDEETNAGGPN